MSYPGPPQAQPVPGQPQFGGAPQYAPPGAPPYGQPPMGQPMPGQSPGHPMPGQPPMGHPMPGQQAAGQPMPGRPPMPNGAPQFPQGGPYGQPPQGMPPQGRPPMPGAQPPMPYGGPGAQAPAAGQGMPGDPPGLTVDASYTPLAFLLAITKPKIIVNGQQVPNTRWGANHIPVGPGQHHVKVSTPWLFDMGPATTAVPVAEGQAARLYYRAPALIFLNGAIGPGPQKTPGMVFVYISWACAALLILLSILPLLLI
ncbi:hypothetical protein [Nocardia cyriacigeorgica]|uniref:hypothetical protein n=2 Tax=Nocardia cyriacigeorgica TaxID=135487 RepID=UPI001E561367|nr:hypothetical protein [Nocardia cyriacigeorgica]